MNLESRKLISIVTPCYNEESNVAELYLTIKHIFESLPQYRYEHIFIDNASTDCTVSIIKKLAKDDKNLKLIVNSRNFGHIRSPYYGMLQANGDAVIILSSDFQEPPELIVDFLKKWEENYKIVIGIKKKSKENKLMFLIRKCFYALIRHISDSEHIDQFIGFGLYDKKIISILRTIDDPYPYLRGIIPEIGFTRYHIEYVQNCRKAGRTKNNFFSLYDMAMLGIVNHSKVPLRISVYIGLSISIFCIGVALFYLGYKLLYWNSFQVGLAPLVIGLFFIGAVQLFFIGMVGEYVGAIYTQIKHRPLVIEEERVNFE